MEPLRNQGISQLDVTRDPTDAPVPPESRRRAANVSRVLHRWLIFAVLPVVVVAWGLHDITERSQARRSQEAAVKSMAHALASWWPTQEPCTAEELQKISRQLIAQPAVFGAAVFNSLGAPLAQAVRNPDLSPLFNADRAGVVFTDAPVTLTAPKELADEFPFIQRMDVDLGPQFSGDRPVRWSLLVGALDPLALGGSSWRYLGVLAAIAALTVLLASRALRRKIVLPISNLLDTSTGPLSSIDLTGQPAQVPEFDALAGTIVELREEAFHWRGQAERVERRMALQIASQTREISRDLRRVQREAWIDALTGVKNRRFLDEQLPAVFAAHSDAALDLSLVMIDLDHFKRLNDERGHPAGDEVLIFVGELLRQCLRADDIAVRYGGDEFVLILPGIAAEDAVALTRRLTALFAQRVKVMFDGQLIVGMTAGIASLVNTRPRTPAGLLAAADHALYRAKKSGRGGIHLGRSYERKSA